MDMRERNIQAIVDYFAAGAKDPNAPLKLGVELEHIITDDALGPVSYSQEHGIAWVLRELAEEFPRITQDEDGNLLGVSRSWQYVTLEPAAQLELSAGPYEGIGQIRIEFEEFQRTLAAILEPYGRRALTTGYHPTAQAGDLELIPKERYRFMDAHFARTGTMGRRMMRGSASTQVSIDYTSEADCLHKLRLANGLAPLMAFLCDNAPRFEGAARPRRMVRTTIWRNTDPARCGLVSGVMEPGFTLERYAACILDAPAVFAKGEDGAWHATDQTFAEVHGQRAMDTADVEHALSLMFHDVRLKTYIENRAADAMPIPYVTAYAALIKGLFYTDAGRAALDDLLDGAGDADVDEAKDALLADGFDARVYGRVAADALEALIATAHDALETNERTYLGPLTQLTRIRKTLADMAAR